MKAAILSNAVGLNSELALDPLNHDEAQLGSPQERQKTHFRASQTSATAGTSAQSPHPFRIFRVEVKNAYVGACDVTEHAQKKTASR